MVSYYNKSLCILYNWYIISLYRRRIYGLYIIDIKNDIKIITKTVKNGRFLTGCSAI